MQTKLLRSLIKNIREQHFIRALFHMRSLILGEDHFAVKYYLDSYLYNHSPAVSVCTKAAFSVSAPN